MLMGIAVARGAAMYDHSKDAGDGTHKYATQTQSYGPAARGGHSRCDVKISEKEIHYPFIDRPDILVLMSEQAYKKYLPDLKESGIVIMDGDLIKERPDCKFFLVPATNSAEALSTANASLFNTVRVHVRRDPQHNSPIDLYFAGVFGRLTANISAEAYATFKDGVVGYKVTDNTGNAELLPLALKVTAWNNLLAGSFTTGDNYTYNPTTGAVTAGHDGINELNLYPGGGATQLPPGNFGTVDIGSPNNSTADLSRQIRYGVNADDLAYFGGELKLGADGTLLLNGDTGLSAGIKDDLTSIIGKPRAIPLFSTVAGPGNNAMFTIVGFAGIRILDVKLTGSMSSKKVIIQPAFIVDDAVLTGPGSGSSYFVYQPVHLVR